MSRSYIAFEPKQRRQMKQLKKPSVKTPYDEICELNPEWKDEMIEVVRGHISYIEDLLRKEAIQDHLADILDPDKMYERFKENIKYRMTNGNWIILKYFRILLRLKVYHEIIGEWLYTEEDREMYEYFRNMKVTKSSKPKRSHLTYKEEGVLDTIPVDLTKNFLFYYELDVDRTNNILEVNYLDFYYSRILRVDDMFNNCTLDDLYFDDGLFDADEPFVSITLATNTYHIKSKSIYRQKDNYEIRLESNINPLEQILALIDSHLKVNSEYRRLKKKLSEIIAPEVESVIAENSTLYERMNDFDRSKLNKFIEAMENL